jgi:hypothetical protein
MAHERSRSEADLEPPQEGIELGTVPSAFEAVVSATQLMSTAVYDSDDDDTASAVSDDERLLDDLRPQILKSSSGKPHKLPERKAPEPTVFKSAEELIRVAVAKFSPNKKIQARAAYTFGLVNTALTFFLAGRSAHLTAVYFTIKFFLIMTTRYVSWRKKGWHYYMVDLCYVVSFLLVLFTSWCFLPLGWLGKTGPAPEWLFRSLFGLAFGPLAWSVAAFSNRAFFHSLDHLGSVFIHVSPALVTYCIRYEGPKSTFGVVGETLVRSYNVLDWGLPLEISSWDAFQSSLLELAASVAYTWSCGMLLYLLWVSMYSAFIFVFAAPRIKKRGYATLFSFVVEGDNSVGKYLRSKTSDIWLQRLFFLGLHGTFAAVTTLIAGLLYHTKAGALLWVITIGSLAVWNSSGMYMEAVALYLHAKAEGKKKKKSE